VKSNLKNQFHFQMRLRTLNVTKMNFLDILIQKKCLNWVFLIHLQEKQFQKFSWQIPMKTN